MQFSGRTHILGKTDTQVVDLAGGDVKGFEKQVIAESVQQIVMVDFWAPWCRPCRQLSPVLEHVARAEGIRVVKINIDNNQLLAGQMGVQSVPTVYAFWRKRPIDGFQGVIPEPTMRVFFDRVRKKAKEPDSSSEPKKKDSAIANNVSALLSAGQASAALSLTEQVLSKDPENETALTGMVEALLRLEEFDKARKKLEGMPRSVRDKDWFATLEARMNFAQKLSEVPDAPTLERALAANPKDVQTRFHLALRYQALGRSSEAGENLLAIVKEHPDRKEAHQQLLDFFKIWGDESDTTKNMRRRMSRILF